MFREMELSSSEIKFFFIFREKELSSPKLKKLLIFQVGTCTKPKEQKKSALKKFLVFYDVFTIFTVVKHRGISCEANNV